MARNFFETIEDGMFIVKHEGEEVELRLPEWLCEASVVLEDESGLVQWANENEIMHGLLHNGMQKLLIDLRAAARPHGKDAKEKSIVAEFEKAQQRVMDFILEPVKRPKAAGADKAAVKREAELDTLRKTIVGMQSAGMEDEQIIAIMSGQFDPIDVVGIVGEKES